ncbi:uncharacterized protein LOC143468371 isoform X1 [Clavelina lepadiformis]|uniref:uncharacterized protein LOC143468371 isoform X1 n=1 Tax=Clavelina lepadiformis TaxID=159417 RepID=UPI0040426BD2
MEETGLTANFYRRQSRQMQLEEVMKFGVLGFKKKELIQRGEEKTLVLPPVGNRKASYAGESHKHLVARTRAKSIAIMRLPEYDEGTGGAINAQRPIKLPQILNRKTKTKRNEDGHWHLPTRRVSKQNDKLIVHHLRYKLLKQHERRSIEYEAIKALNDEEDSIASMDSFDEDTLRWMHAVRSRGPSLSTLNFSSAATSRLENLRESDEPSALSRRPSTISQDSQQGLTAITNGVNVNEANKERSITFQPLPPISRPTICISTDTGLTDWIEEKGRLRSNDNDIIKEEESSQLQKSINESDRSVSLLMQKVRRRSTLVEIPESKKEGHVAMRQGSLSSVTSINGQLLPSSKHTRKLDGDKVPSSCRIKTTDIVDPDIPIGDVTLFADWKSQVDSPERSRSGSFLSDVITARDDATNNSFVVESLPSSSYASSSEQNKTQDKNSGETSRDNIFEEEIAERDEEVDPDTRSQLTSKIILGDVTIPEPPLRRKVSIYVISAGIDTAIERSYLNDAITPKLRNFCRERNLTFELIDLNSFPSEMETAALERNYSKFFVDSEHSLEHMQTELMRQCFKDSLGPCFMCFMGDTVGTRFKLPASIPNPVFEWIMRRIQEEVANIELQILELNASMGQAVYENFEPSSKQDSPASSDITFNGNTTKLLGKVASLKSNSSNLSSRGSAASGVSTKKKEVTRHEDKLSSLREKMKTWNNEETLLRKWYLRDTNTPSSPYRLKDISGEFSTFASITTTGSNSEIEKRRREQQYWMQIQTKLQSILAYFAYQEDYESQSEPIITQWKKKVFRTSLEEEIHLATSVSVSRASESCFWFHRNLHDYQNFMTDDELKNFIPLKPLTVELEARAVDKIEQLSENLTEKLGYSNIRDYPLPWQAVQRAYTANLKQKNLNRTWSMYLERMGLDFYNVCTMQIDNAVEKYHAKERNFLTEEIQEHAGMARSLSSSFVGQQSALYAIKSYLRTSKNRKPLVVCGEVGCGKTALMSQAAIMTQTWMEGKARRINVLQDYVNDSQPCRVLFRSIGLTSDSIHPRTFLSSICVQLRLIVDEIERESGTDKSDESEIMKPKQKESEHAADLNFRDLSLKFSNLLNKCGSKLCPLVLFLDNLDGLRDEHDAKKFKWLPAKLPKHVKVVVSVTKEGITENIGSKSSSSLKRSTSSMGQTNLHNTADSTGKHSINSYQILKELYDFNDEFTCKRITNLVLLSPLKFRSSGTELEIPNEEANTFLEDIVTKLLEIESRSLTPQQIQVILEKCKLCPRALAAEICLLISRIWRSSTTLEECADQLPQNADDIESFVHCFFRWLEDKHGRPMVAAASCLLALSAHGLTSSEIRCLLSYDQNISKWIVDLLARNPTHQNTKIRSLAQANNKIVNEINSKSVGSKSSATRTNSKRVSNEKPLVPVVEFVKRQRIPDILWQRFFKDFSIFLHETLSDNLLTLRWKHEIYQRICEKRYMATKENQKYYHHLMACYFTSQIPTKLTSQPKEKATKGKLPVQALCSEFIGEPLSWEIKEENHENIIRKESGVARHNKKHKITSKTIFNLRRLSESPYHYLQCRTLEQIKNDMLFNYEWLLAKIQSSLYEGLIETISSVLVPYRSDNDLRLLAEALHLSRKILKKDPRQLAAQLVGRLHEILKKDKPLARMDPRKYPSCRRLIAQCRRSPIPVLIPSGTCLVAPREILFDLHSGHHDVINALAMTSDGHRAITSSRDETLKIWDLFSGRVTHTLRGMPRHVISLCLCMGNNYVALLDRKNKISAVCLRTKSIVSTLTEPNEERVVISAAGDGQSYLLVFCDQAKLLKVWDLEKMRMTHKIDISPDHLTLRDEQWLLTAKCSRSNSILYSFHACDEAYVYDVKRAKHLQTLKLNNEDGFALITHVEVSREYYVIACKRRYMLLHEIVTFEVYDAINYGHVRAFKACPEDSIFDIFLNRLGSHIIALCRGSAGTEVAVWNVETGNHQHMAYQKIHSTQGCCVDLECCLTCSETETTLQVHNLAARIDKKTLSKTQVKEKSLGIGEFYPVTSNSRYVVARGMDNGPITVWNITRGRCKGEAVSIERGLLEKNDVVVVKDVQVIVLSDRGISSSDDGSRLVFKTIYIYDLRTKKYTKKLHPVTVTVCPSHEYRILGFDKLLAVSHDRTYFVIWSLISGEVLSKLRLNFSKYELAERAAKEKKNESRRKLKRQKTAKRLVVASIPKSSEDSNFHLSFEERNKPIDQMMLSDDESTLLCSFYSRHVAVFDMESQQHIHTLTNKHSMLLLHQAQVTSRGCHLVHTNYDDDAKLSYLTVWSLRQGLVVRRMKNEPLVCALTTSDHASKVVYATEDNYLKIWEPLKRGAHRKIPGYEGLRMRKRSNGCQGTTVYLTGTAKRAILFTYDISLWDLEKEYVLAKFTPDVPFQCCTVAINGNLIVAGMRDAQKVVTLRLMSHDQDVRHFGRAVLGTEKGMFGEKEEKDSESSEDEIVDDDSDNI